MGFTPGIIYDNTAAGWSSFTPVIVEGWASQQGSGYNGTGTRFIYVAANGNDSNPGTAASPKLTVNGGGGTGGCSLLRNGHPDWLMLRQGDTFVNQLFDAPPPTGPGFFFLGGQDNQNFMLITSYDPANPQVPHPGTGNRPVVETPGNSIGMYGIGSFLALVGIELYAYQRDFQNPNYMGDGSLADCSGLKIATSSFQWFWLEDCYVHCFGSNIPSDQDGTGSTCDQMHIRRCIITDSVNQGSTHSQGLNTECCTNSSVEENLFDYNGWDTQRSGMNQFNRNMYLSWDSHVYSSEYPPISVRGNITTNNASNDQIRCGGTWDNNYSESFSQGIALLTATGQTSNITNSVFYGQYTDGNVNLVPCVATGKVGQGRNFLGSAIVTGNILSSPSTLSAQTPPGGINIPYGADGDNWSSNCIYNYDASLSEWPLSDGNSPPGVQISNGYTGRGCPVSFSVTNPGSGYTTGTVWKFYINPAGAVNPGDSLSDGHGHTFVVQNSSTFNACQAESGRTDVALWATGSQAPAASSGTLTGGSFGSITYNNVSRAILNVGQASTSGGGSGANLLLEANLSGAIISAIPQGDGINGDPSIANQGGTVFSATGYSNNDSITIAASGGGSGCVVTVTRIGQITVGGNKSYAGTWSSNPFGWIGSTTRSSSTYMTSLGQSPATLNGFVALCKQQRKGNWNSNYTAGALNNYIRAGFLLPAYPAVSGPTITTTSLANGFVGVPYSDQVVATGGTPPYTFARTSGSLPNGVTLGANGVLSGIPTAAGTFSFTVTATDSANNTSLGQSYTVSPVVNVVMAPSGAQTLFVANILGHS